MPFIETSDAARLYYTEWGAGQPVLFLIGWALSSDMWQYQRIHLDDQGLRTLDFDRRGHGRSDDPGVATTTTPLPVIWQP